jgi:hypothetical protein
MLGPGFVLCAALRPEASSSQMTWPYEANRGRTQKACSTLKPPMNKRFPSTGMVGPISLNDGSSIIAFIARSRSSRDLYAAHDSRARARPRRTSWWGCFRGTRCGPGYATTATEHDEPSYRIQQRMRHRSMDTTGGYIRAGPAVEQVRAQGVWVLKGQGSIRASSAPSLQRALLRDERF